MMKYEEMELEVIRFDEEDVICTSNQSEGQEFPPPNNGN